MSGGFLSGGFCPITVYSTLWDVQYTGGYHEYSGGYHEYTWGCSVHWGLSGV